MTWGCAALNYLSIALLKSAAFYDSCEMSRRVSVTADMFTFTCLLDIKKHVIRELMYNMPPLMPASCFFPVWACFCVQIPFTILHHSIFSELGCSRPSYARVKQQSSVPSGRRGPWELGGSQTARGNGLRRWRLQRRIHREWVVTYWKSLWTETHLHMCYIHYTTFVLTEISRQLLDVLPCIVRTFTCSDPRFSLIKVKCDGFRARNWVQYSFSSFHEPVMFWI